jgi:hypothetical protein
LTVPSESRPGKKAIFVAGSAAIAVLVPALALAAPAAKRAPAVALSFDSISAFTPAGADPRLAAAFAGRAPTISDFKFTPAAAKGRPAQVRVAVRARSAAPAGNAEAALVSAPPVLTPASYNLGAAVGWKRFAVSGDVARAKGTNPDLGAHETAVVGVSYNLKKFTGRVAVEAERDRARIAALQRPDSYAVDLGGAYNISRRVAVTGGVRYRVDQDRAAALADSRSDSKAVYVGTAFKF